MNSPRSTDPRADDLRHFSAEDRAWLAALAGLPESSEQASATRMNQESTMTPNQAVQLRQYFTQRNEVEQSQALGAESEARMLARMHRMGAFRSKPVQASPHSPAHAATAPKSQKGRPKGQSSWSSWLDAWLPSGPAATSRYVWIAGVALVAMVVPALLPQAPQSADPMTAMYKSAPLQGQHDQLVLVAQPADHLQQMQAALQAKGVPVQVKAQGKGYQLQVQASQAQQAAVQQALQPWGVSVSPKGAVKVNIQPAE